MISMEDDVYEEPYLYVSCFESWGAGSCLAGGSSRPVSRRPP